MNKYINIILLSFFGVLSIKHNLSLTFYIPFVIYYSYKNIKNIILIIPFSLLSVYLFNINNYIIFIILYISLIILLLIIKQNKKLYFCLYSLIINIIIYYILKYQNNINNNIYLELFSFIICPLILLYLIYNNITNINIKNIIYNEFLLGIILCIGSSYYKIYDIPISFIIAIYFAMYLSSNKYMICSVIYSFIMVIFMNKFIDYDYSIITLFISFIYLIPNIFSSISLMLLSIYILYFKPNNIPLNIFYMLGIISIIFEILRPIIINNKNKIEVINNTYEKSMIQVENDLEAFSLLLDKISNNISNNEYNEEMNNAVSSITKVVCFKCDNLNNCYKTNKAKVYYFIKNTILNNEDDFICIKKDQIKRYSRNINKSFLDTKNNNNLVLPVLNNISNILRQYKVDNSLKNEIDFNSINDLKDGLLDYGYTISLFNVIKTFKNDLLIEIGIVGISYYNEKENIENVSSYYLDIPVSCILKETKKNKTYINIIPKTNYEIIYGYGSISKVGNSICGDNYLVKDLNNKKFISIICDGMGKGINANRISYKTIELLDELSNTNISSETSINILNSFYLIQDYMENYTTMDYTEIDKTTADMLLYKAGATYSYIIHDDGTYEKIENDSLPFGLNELVITKKIKLKDKDLVILASDGIFDNIINEIEFESFILSIRNQEPQKIAYEILNYARNTDLISKDDMSVITLKIKHI